MNLIGEIRLRLMPFFKKLKAARITIAGRFFQDEALQRTRCRHCEIRGIDNTWSWHVSSEAMKGHLYRYHLEDLKILYEEAVKSGQAKPPKMPTMKKQQNRQNQASSKNATNATLNLANATQTLSQLGSQHNRNSFLSVLKSLTEQSMKGPGDSGKSSGSSGGQMNHTAISNCISNGVVGGGKS